MRHRIGPGLLASLLFAALVFTGAPAFSESGPIQVGEWAVCTDVVDRACVGADTHFSSRVGKLFCFTRIVGAQSPVTVTHVWYFEERERARVELPVRSADWRTYSSKIIQPREIGYWRVNILGPDGMLLKAVEFEITP